MNLQHAVAAFNAAYTGRDFALPQRLNWWVEELGPEKDVSTLDADIIDAAMVRLANRVACADSRLLGKVNARAHLDI